LLSLRTPIVQVPQLWGEMLSLIERYGYFFVFLGVMLMGVGIPLPGETVLLTAGALSILASRIWAQGRDLVLACQLQATYCVWLRTRARTIRRTSCERRLGRIG
jgi:membrane protein DedA with SNARE-associated domain